MKAKDLTMLQSWELRNICDCNGFDYHVDSPQFKPLMELAKAGLLKLEPDKDNDASWYRFTPTSQGRAVAEALERRK